MIQNKEINNKKINNKNKNKNIIFQDMIIKKDNDNKKMICRKD